MLSCIEAARVLAQYGFNFDQFAFMLEQKKYIGRGLDIVQKIETLYPDVWEIRAGKIGCQGSILQFRYFYDQDLSKEKLGEELEPLKTALATMAFTNESADQALGMSWGARQDAKYNPIMGSGIDEIDEEEALCRMLAAYQPEVPYRREHRKIGANEPCPCGSGKKFKKCCSGNGRYDLYSVQKFDILRVDLIRI